MMSSSTRPRRDCLLLAAVILAALAAGSSSPLHAQLQTWSLCGQVVEESQTQLAEVEVELVPAGASEPRLTDLTDARGEFCFFRLAAGTYALTASKKPWPPQPTHEIEVGPGQPGVIKLELEWEPGEPRATFEESLDGLQPGDRRALLERLLRQGDAESLHELARCLVPKRSVGIELAPLTRGLETKKLVDELLRYLERGYLPPLKTARFLHVLGELGDERPIPLLLRKLTDGRRLPPGSYLTWAGFYDPEKNYYVSDEAALALAKITGRDFKYRLGLPPLQNQRAINGARAWWRDEQLRRRDRQRRP